MNDYVKTERNISISDKVSNHTWNVINLDEKWHYVDVTWASPTSTKYSRPIIS